MNIFRKLTFKELNLCQFIVYVSRIPQILVHRGRPLPESSGPFILHVLKSKIWVSVKWSYINYRISFYLNTDVAFDFLFCNVILILCVVQWSRFHLYLQKDQKRATHPEYSKTFENFKDVIRGLVPYHVFQTKEPSDEEITTGVCACVCVICQWLKIV